ncbi:MAG: Rieske 2Fe-2S domain-containing protein [Planctomycetes bacterium]|nr:Rieske 2Fe-2S domain-containing protein [Planctomycetota bacterium]
MPHHNEPPEGTTRRGFASWVLMVTGLIAGYGAGALHFFRYLVPLHREGRRREMFIGTLGTFDVGTTRTVRDPRGQEIIIARVADNPDQRVADFRALSTKCPHLGCKIHWESGKDRFRCPCHEGIFDKQGKAVSGPPAAEGKNLTEYQVHVNKNTGNVYVMVTQESPYGA